MQYKLLQEHGPKERCSNVCESSSAPEAKPAAAATTTESSSKQVGTTTELKNATEAWVKMKVNFTINSIKATLYIGDSSLVSGHR